MTLNDRRSLVLLAKRRFEICQAWRVPFIAESVLRMAVPCQWFSTARDNPFRVVPGARAHIVVSDMNPMNRHCKSEPGCRRRRHGCSHRWSTLVRRNNKQNRHMLLSWRAQVSNTKRGPPWATLKLLTKSACCVLSLIPPLADYFYLPSKVSYD